jgi:holo-[acyl-carrier protein] synthase
MKSSTKSLRIGCDIVQIDEVATSMAAFPGSFEARLFTELELAYAYAGSGLEAQRLAARFAAKEAVIKALDLSDAGVSWRDIEVEKLPTGECELRFHGRVAEIAGQLKVVRSLLSLSHGGSYAMAFVVMDCEIN